MRAPNVNIGILFALMALLFLYRLGSEDLYRSHEARAAQNAHMILSDGCWGVPKLFDGRVEEQKPPLFYWLVACLGWLRGGVIDGWSVRLPAALAGLGTVLTIFVVGWRRQRPRAGLFAAGVLATFVHFTWLARVGRIDMPLTFAVTLSLSSFYLAEHAERKNAWKLLGYLALAVGILLKGPIALVLIGLVGGLHTLVGFVREWRARVPGKVSSLWWGTLVVLAVAGPWFAWISERCGSRWWYVFFYEHHILRSLGEDRFEAHPCWFYGPRIFVDMLPWSLGLPWAGWLLVKRHGDDPEMRWGALWLSSIVVLLSCISFKRSDYLLPAYPGAALVLGCALERALPQEWTSRSWRMALGVLGFFVLGWGIYAEVQTRREGAGWTYRTLGAEIRRHSNAPVIFFRAEAHALALEVNRPLDTILEWENLQWWANRPEAITIVMPPDCADQWREHLQGDVLEEVLRTKGNRKRSERPLVVVRSRGGLAGR